MDPARLTVDLRTQLSALAAASPHAGALVKADGCGLGVRPFAAARDAGCAGFFVNTPAEGAHLAREFPDIRIRLVRFPSALYPPPYRIPVTR